MAEATTVVTEFELVTEKEAAVVVAEAARVAEAPQEASEATVVATEAAGGADHRTGLWIGSPGLGLTAHRLYQ